MSENLAKWHNARKPNQAQEEELSEAEAKALKTIQSEAKKNGVTLTHDGKGGLPPSLVLGVFRRDGWECKIHGDRGEDDYGGLQVHHKAGAKNLVSARLLKKGHSNDPTNLVTLCEKAHDAIHDKDRRVGVEMAKAVEAEQAQEA